MDQLNNAKQAVFKSSDNSQNFDASLEIKGYDFNTFDPEKTTIHELLSTYLSTGIQASHLGRAIDIVNMMLNYSDIDEDNNPIKCKVFLGYTSNLITSGLREIIKYLTQHKLVDCIVTTAGGIEEDLIKCMAPTYLHKFNADDNNLRQKGLNRVGNMLIPNKNYCLFETFMHKSLDIMLNEQKENDINWTPSKIINKLGKEINNEDSICYWAYKVF